MRALDVPEPAAAAGAAPASPVAGAFAARWWAQAPSSSSTAAAVIARLNMACPPRDLGCYSQQQITAALSSAQPTHRGTMTRSRPKSRAGAPPGFQQQDQGTSMPTGVPSGSRVVKQQRQHGQG